MFSVIKSIAIAALEFMVCQLEVVSKTKPIVMTQSKTKKKFIFCWEQQHVINAEDCSNTF